MSLIEYEKLFYYQLFHDSKTEFSFSVANLHFMRIHNYHQKLNDINFPSGNSSTESAFDTTTSNFK